MKEVSSELLTDFRIVQRWVEDCCGVVAAPFLPEVGQGRSEEEWWDVWIL